jgi:hypothetical protein
MQPKGDLDDIRNAVIADGLAALVLEGIPRLCGNPNESLAKPADWDSAG